MIYTIYNPQTGEIIRNVNCSEDIIIAQVLDGEAYVEGMFDANHFAIIDGQAVEQERQQDIKITWLELRAARDRKLSACDWTQVADAPVDHAAWAAYRQALRDLPSSTADPSNPVWPEPPTSDKTTPNHEVNT
jgi:hypothetical protein